MTAPREVPRVTGHQPRCPQTSYPIRLCHHEGGWQITIHGIGVTYARHLGGVEAAAQQLLAAALGGEPGDYTVEG